MPPTSSGSTLRVASTLRPAAFSICATIACASSSRQLARRRQLDRQPLLLARHQPLELARDLLDLARAALLGREEEEVLDERLVVACEVGEDARLHRRLELRVAQHRAELGRLLDRGGEVGERLVHLREAAGLLGRLEQRLGVDAVRDRQLDGLLQAREVESRRSPPRSARGRARRRACGRRRARRPRA